MSVINSNKYILHGIEFPIEKFIEINWNNKKDKNNHLKWPTILRTTDNENNISYIVTVDDNIITISTIYGEKSVNTDIYRAEEVKSIYVR